MHGVKLTQNQQTVNPSVLCSKLREAEIGSGTGPSCVPGTAQGSRSLLVSLQGSAQNLQLQLIDAHVFFLHSKTTTHLELGFKRKVCIKNLIILVPN